MSSIKNNLYLTRFVNNNERYLKINYSKTLFDDIYIVIVIYGAKKNLRPTGIKKHFFSTLEAAIDYYKKYVDVKYGRGYQANYYT